MKNLRKCAVRTAALFFLFFQIPAFGQALPDIGTLSATIASGTPEEKRDALYLLRVIGGEEAARVAVPALSDREEIVRATAAGVTAMLPADEAAAALIPLLSDKKSFVRKEACLAIGKARASAAMADITRILQKDEKPDVRAAAATTLGLIGGGSSVPFLLEAIRKRGGSKNAYLRREAAFAIGRIAELSEARGTSATFPESFLPEKFKSAGLAGSIDFENTSVTLRDLLVSEKEPAEVRRAAAFAIGAIGAVSARSDIERCASSEDPYLAETCREALRRFRIELPDQGGPRLPASITSTSFRLLDGDQFKISEAKDRPVLLVLWAMWSGPCVHLMEQLRELDKRYVKEGLIIVALNVDPESEEDLVAFVRSKKIDFRVGWADETTVETLFAESERNGVPQTFILDRNHDLQGMFLGSGSGIFAKLESELSLLISN